MNIFRTIALCSVSFWGLTASAQVVDDVAGKTYYYYDAVSGKKVKEIYHHRQIVKIMPDRNNRGSYTDTFMYQKHGPYTLYDEKGHLICSGYFDTEQKDSIWKYYNEEGNMIRSERWRKGTLLK